ncbi:MAG: biotin--[acetyl-CoA-carboxylase] ligase [Rhodospirillales bacterium]
MTVNVALPAGYRLIAYDHATSTNQIALDRISAGEAVDGDVVWALQQSAGRGRQGREWQSLPGNLFTTFIIRHAGRLENAAELSFVATLAVQRAIKSLIAHPEAPAVAGKWPNDVLIGGKKAAGILLEVAGTPGDAGYYIAVGIGINLLHAPENTRYPATSLSAALGQIVEPGEMLTNLARHLNAAMQTWREEGFGRIRQDWLANAHGVGEPISVTAGERSLDGRFAGIDANGALLLETVNGSLAINAGDVHFPAMSKST